MKDFWEFRRPVHTQWDILVAFVLGIIFCLCVLLALAHYFPKPAELQPLPYPSEVPYDDPIQHYLS